MDDNEETTTPSPLRQELLAAGQRFIGGHEWDPTGNRNKERDGEALLSILRTNDCRDILSSAQAGDDFANLFLHLINKNDRTVIDAFLQSGMNIDIRDNYGYSVVIEACRNGLGDLLSWLLSKNANPNIQTSNGLTALHVAAINNRIEIVPMLLEKNADTELLSTDDSTALMIACQSGRKEIVALLLNHGVNTEVKNKAGKTAFDLATEEDIKAQLLDHVTNSYVLK